MLIYVGRTNKEPYTYTIFNTVYLTSHNLYYIHVKRLITSGKKILGIEYIQKSNKLVFSNKLFDLADGSKIRYTFIQQNGVVLVEPYGDDMVSFKFIVRDTIVGALNIERTYKSKLFNIDRDLSYDTDFTFTIDNIGYPFVIARFHKNKYRCFVIKNNKVLKDTNWIDTNLSNNELLGGI